MMSGTKDKGELLIIANLAEQSERYDGKLPILFSVRVLRDYFRKASSV